MYVPQPINPRAVATFLTPIAPEWVPILVADDHEESRIITRMMLECAGHRVFEASSGTEALEIAFAERPRAAILDIVMPELDGWSTARRLRKDPRTSSMILMAVTALAGESDRVRSIAAGFDTVLVKPVRPLRMLEVLRSFMPAADSSFGAQRPRTAVAAAATELRTRV